MYTPVGSVFLERRPWLIHMMTTQASSTTTELLHVCPSAAVRCVSATQVEAPNLGACAGAVTVTYR